MHPTRWITLRCFFHHQIEWMRAVMICIGVPIRSLVASEETPRWTFVNLMFQRIMIILSKPVDMFWLKSSDELKKLVVQHQTTERGVQQNRLILATTDCQGKNTVTRAIRWMVKLILPWMKFTGRRRKWNGDLEKNRHSIGYVLVSLYFVSLLIFVGELQSNDVIGVIFHVQSNVFDRLGKHTFHSWISFQP